MVRSNMRLDAPEVIVHEVDGVLDPIVSGDLITALAADPEKRFSTFLKALRAAGMDKELADYASKTERRWTRSQSPSLAGPWTVFAPVNEAFMNLPMEELENLIRRPEELRALLLNHVVGRTIYSEGLRPHQRILMAGGRRVNVFRRKGRLKVEGANVVNVDIPADNGVIQVVETIVELPEEERLDDDRHGRPRRRRWP